MRRFLLDYVAPVAFIIVFAAYGWAQRDQLETLSSAPLLDMVLIGVLVAVAHFLNSTEFWILYRAQGVVSGIFENWMVFFAANLGNYLPAQAGALYRVRYMKSVHEVSYAATVAVYGANLIITLVGAAVAGLVGAMLLALTGSQVPVLVIAGYTSLLALAVAVQVAPLPQFLARSGRMARAWRSIRDGFEQTRQSRRLTAMVVVIEAVKYGVTAMRFLLAFRLVGVEEPYWFFLALAPAAGIAQFISFTPGALGFREAFLSATTVALGSPLATGFLASAADRAVMLVTSLLLGTLGFATTYPTLRRAELAAAAGVGEASGDP